MVFDEFCRQIKDLLDHLDDTAYLQVHPLLPQIIDVSSAARTTRAEEVRSVLISAIEALRPQQGAPSGSPEWRSYLALRHRYVERMSTAQIEDRMGISLRQLQRELAKGLSALSQLLWDRYMAQGPRVAVPAEYASEKLRALCEELSQWELSRRACEVRTLLEDALWMFHPTGEEPAPTVHLDVPADLPPVLADCTLVRQALVIIARQVTQLAAPLLLRARLRHRYVDIIIPGQSAAADPASEDWQMAEMLIRRQGGELAVYAADEEDAQIVLSLPSANQIRVLVVDDNQAIHQLFERYLALHQYELIHAYSAQEALQLAVEAHPDVIMLDIMLPGVDGWQILRSLVQSPETQSIPIVVCSVLSEPELALSIGARAYLRKPVGRLELVTTLAGLFPPSTPAMATSPTAPEDSRASRQ